MDRPGYSRDTCIPHALDTADVGICIYVGVCVCDWMCMSIEEESNRKIQSTINWCISASRIDTLCSVELNSDAVNTDMYVCMCLRLRACTYGTSCRLMRLISESGHCLTITRNIFHIHRYLYTVELQTCTVVLVRLSVGAIEWSECI